MLPAAAISPTFALSLHYMPCCGCFPSITPKSVLTLEGLIPGRQIPKHLSQKRVCVWGWVQSFLRLMRTGVRVMKRYCARGYWNNLRMEMLFQPIDFWEAGSISTLDNNKAKYSSRKHCRQSSWRKKVHCELSGLFFQYLTMYTSLWEILDLIPFTT